MESKYYINPFREDDAEACYAEIDMMEDAERGHHDTDTMPSMSREHTMERSMQSITNAAPPSVRTASPQEQKVNLTSGPPVRNTTPHDSDEAQQTRTEYAAIIQQLRQQVEQLSAENNALYTSQSRLQAQLRTLTLENESLQWAARCDKERQTTLTQCVKDLEDELSRTQSRTQEMLKNIESSYASQNKSVSVNRERSSDFLQQEAKHIDAAIKPLQAPAPSGEVPQTRHSQLDTATRDASTDDHRRPSGPATLTSARRQLSAMMTDEEREALRERERAIVEQLEAELLAHSQKRDELNSQLQRLESSRLRNASDRQRKMQAETDLQQEEKILGNIKLQLRAHSSLTR